MVLLSLLRRSKLSAYTAEDDRASCWTCTACGEPNRQHRRACNNCGASQPDQSDVAGQPGGAVHSPSGTPVTLLPDFDRPSGATDACIGGTASPRASGEKQSCQDDAAIAAALQAEEDLAAQAQQQQSTEGGSRPEPRSAWPVGSDQADRTVASGSEADTMSPRRRCILRVGIAAAVLLLLGALGVVWYLIDTGHLLQKGGAPKTSSPTEEAADISQEFENISRAALAATNKYRTFKGLSSLDWHQGLASIAVDHAGEMAAGSMPFSHEGFQNRISRYPMHAVRAAENLGQCKGHEDVATCAVNGWILSPEHEQNLAGDFDHCGIGTARNSTDGRWFITQLFAATP